MRLNVDFDAIFTPDPTNSTGRFAKVTGAPLGLGSTNKRDT